MNSTDLTAQQLKNLQKQLQPHTDNLKSLFARIEQQWFPISDQLRLRVFFTRDQLEALQHVVEKLAANRVHRDMYMMGIRTRDWKRRLREKRNKTGGAFFVRGQNWRRVIRCDPVQS